MHFTSIESKSKKRILIIGPHSASIGPAGPSQADRCGDLAFSLHVDTGLLLLLALRKNRGELKIDDAKSPVGLTVSDVAHFRIIMANPEGL